MRFGSDWNRMQQVADHRMACKTLRTGAIGSMIMGGVGIGLGMIPPADGVTIGIGVALLGTGIWNISRPQPAGIVIDGLTFIMVGAFNILGSLGTGGGLWAKLGVFQLYWGVQGILRFKKFRTALSFAPQDTEVRMLDDAVRTIEKTKVKDTVDAIEFTTSGLHAKLWRGRLTDEGVLLLQVGSHDVVVAARHEFDIEAGDKVMIGNSRKAVFTIKNKTHKGTVSPQSLERFQSWKLGTQIPQALAA